MPLHNINYTCVWRERLAFRLQSLYALRLVFNVYIDMKKEHILQDFIFIYIGLIYTPSNMLNTPPWVNKVSLSYLLLFFISMK